LKKINDKNIPFKKTESVLYVQDPQGRTSKASFSNTSLPLDGTRTKR
jgi:hypothetical protein